ncbi:MAG TPA: ferrochelatase [Chloroflexota bacterium]|nr:ferrochelatase [Chloroflexota bacterium]
MTGGQAQGRTTLGLLLMTYGSPATLEDVPAYLASTRGGRPAPDDLVAEFRRRYALIGGSPLLRITREQAAATAARLNQAAPPGTRFVATVGMRHAPPLIADSLRDLTAQGAQRIGAVILSPQYSPYIMGGYHRAVDAALEAIPGVEVRVSTAWHLHPLFLDALAGRVQEALARFPAGERERVPVILTAHSLPRPVVDREPNYVEQLQETVRAVVDRCALSPRRWQFAYQSAGHTPEEWLKPDLKDVLPGLRATGHRDVLVVPVQFLADHLEILYDIDVAAGQEAREAGLRLHRIESLNTMPLFVDCLAAVARETLGLPAEAPVPVGAEVVRA